MRFDVRLFASLRDHAGASTLTIETSNDGTVACDVAALRRALRSSLPATLVDRCAIAVNHEYVPEDHRLKIGDEIAVIPPVSGG